MDHLDLNQEDFTTRSGGVSSNVHQVCVIITEEAEENDDIDNIVVNTQNNKPRSNSGKEKEKYMSPLESRELSCQQSITAWRYPQTREEKF
jgi:F0F1-type ATP synthase epsilon subunit